MRVVMDTNIVLYSSSQFSDSQLFDQLSDEQKEETLLSLNESQSEENLEDHETVMKEIRAKFGWS